MSWLKQKLAILWGRLIILWYREKFDTLKSKLNQEVKLLLRGHHEVVGELIYLGLAGEVVLKRPRQTKFPGHHMIFDDGVDRIKTWLGDISAIQTVEAINDGDNHCEDD